MPKTLSIKEMKNLLGNYVEWVVGTQIPAVLERQLKVYRALGMRVDDLEQQFNERTVAVFQAVRDANGHEES